jgi:glycerol-3-phosphate acyltransferase PlsY
MFIFLAVILSYLIGSIPNGVVVVRLAWRFDVRDVGSQRTGATNVLRSGSLAAAIIVLILDILKGAGAVWLGRWLVASPLLGGWWMGLTGHSLAWPFPAGPAAILWTQLACGLGAIAGHSWPLYIKFRGGRGVATTMGTLVPLAPVVMLVVFAVSLTLTLVTRFVSVGSVVGMSIVPMGLLVQAGFFSLSFWTILYGLLVSGLVIYQHKDNISRLRKGTERRLGERVEPPVNNGPGAAGK